MTGTGGYSMSETLSTPRSRRTRNPAFRILSRRSSCGNARLRPFRIRPGTDDPAERDLGPPRHGASAHEPARARNETGHASQLVANDRVRSVHRDRRHPRADPAHLALFFQPAGKRRAELSAPRDRLVTAGARELETPGPALPLDAAYPMIARTAPPERVPGPKSRRRPGTGTGPLSGGRPVVSTTRPGLAIASIHYGRRAGRPKAISAPGPKRRGARAA